MTSDIKDDNMTFMKKELIIIRGIQGSGKSTLARKLAGSDGQIFSADDFFVDDQGEYKWNPCSIAIAHRWNHNRMKKAIKDGVSPVILDNTNVKMWDMVQARPLILLGIDKGYEARVEEVDTPWAFDAEQLAEKNSHGVPLSTIKKKIAQWVPNISIEDILNYEK